jgi:hypothetical protein
MIGFLVIALILLCLCKALREAIVVFIVIFALLCLTHDWSKENGQTQSATVQSGKAR